jgi:hypothetical protein
VEGETVKKEPQKQRKKGSTSVSKKPIAGAHNAQKPKNPSAKLPRVRWLSLRDVSSCRRALARIAKEYKLGLIPEAQARAMTYCLRGVLDALKVEQESTLTARMLALEETVAKLKGEDGGKGK